MMRSTSLGIVTACCFMCGPLSAALWIALERSSGLASKTTPSPKTGVMKGYAAAWSRSSSGARKKSSLAAAPDTSTTSRSASWNCPTSPHSSRTRQNSPIGSAASSSRCPCSPSPPDTRFGVVSVLISCLRSSRLRSCLLPRRSCHGEWRPRPRPRRRACAHRAACRRSPRSPRQCVLVQGNCRVWQVRG